MFHDQVTVRDTKDNDKLSVLFSFSSTETRSIQLQVEPAEKGSLILYWAKLCKQSKKDKSIHMYESKIAEFYGVEEAKEM